MRSDIELEPAKIEHDLSKFVKCIGLVRPQLWNAGGKFYFALVDGFGADPEDTDIYFLVSENLGGGYYDRYFIINIRDECYQVSTNDVSAPTLDIDGYKRAFMVTTSNPINVAKVILAKAAIKSYIDQMHKSKDKS